MEKNKSLVSVIIPTFNSSRTIKRCLDSINNQTHSNLEIIICDDFSTDNTIELIRNYVSKFPLYLLVNDKNKGAAFSRNKAISLSKGDYILLQDSDDYSSIDRTEKLLNFLHKSKYGFVGSNYYVFNENTIRKWKSLIPEPNKFDLIKKMQFCHASIMFKRNLFSIVGFYNENTFNHRIEDYDLILKIYKFNIKGYNLNDNLYFYEINSDTLKRRGLNDRLSEFFIKLKWSWRYNYFIPSLPYLILVFLKILTPNFIYNQLKKLK